MTKEQVLDLIKFIVNSKEDLANKVENGDFKDNSYSKGYVDALRMMNEELDKVLKIGGKE